MVKNKMNKLLGILLLAGVLNACEKAEEVEKMSVTEPELSDVAAAYQQQCQQTIATLNSRYAELEAISGPYTLKTVMEPLNDFTILLNDNYAYAELMSSVHPNEALRKAAENCSIELGKIQTRLSLSRPVYEAVSQVDVTHADESAQRNHFLIIQDFRLSGVDKDDATREKIRALQEEIEALGIAFDRNIREDVRSIKVTAEQLAGLPEDYIADHEPDAEGKLTITTRYTDLFPVLNFAENDDVRRELYTVYQQRAYPKNKAVLEQILAKRHQFAELMGYESFADYVTADKMAGSAQNVHLFIDQVQALSAEAAEKDMAKYLARLQKDNPAATEVNRWQIGYLEELIKREDYAVDAREVRQYFAYNKVRDGIFDLSSKLFGVDIRPWQTETWHPSVTAYEMYQNDELIGRFYLDMHPREGKFQHAAAFTNQTGIGGKQLPVNTLVCNFPGDDDPGELLEPEQVRTFLHEFGHLLHAMFAGRNPWSRVSGLNMEWDFVEAPSQMLEEWLYDVDTLQSFATNSDGEPIPAELVEKMNQSRLLGEGYMAQVQLYYSALSLNYHLGSPDNFDLAEKMLELQDLYSPAPHVPETYQFASFGHLNGYSAMYYTYTWSKVIAADMFAQFKEKGLLNTEVAAQYRDKVLAQGALKPAADAVAEFLGRPYSIEAFAQKFSD